MGRVRARVRERINEESAKIRETRAARAEKIHADFLRSVSSTRSSLAGAFMGAGVLAVLGLKWPIAWLGAAVAGFAFIGNLRGPTINGASRSPLMPCGNWAKKHASAKAAADVERDVGALERYISDLAALIELVMRGSTFDHSESQVARRITTAFFLLGYAALGYSDTERTLLFTDGDEQILVRFRHRDGAAVNVTVPQKLAALMRQRGIKTGYLFCSPGLSGNAATFAAANNIRAYTMEEMNEWVNETLASDYGGPAGDILANLDALKEFLSRLSRNLPAHAGRSVGWPKRRRRRRYW
jgi:hypothetical protein